MISSVLGQFWSKNSFFVKKICFAVWSWKLFPGCFHCALTVFDVFDQFLVFVLLGRVYRFQAASLNWYLNGLVKNLFFVRKNVLIRPKNHFQTIFIFFAFFNVFDRFLVFVHFDRFGCFATSFEWFKPFWTSSVKKRFLWWTLSFSCLVMTKCFLFFEWLKLTFSSFGRFWPIFGFCAVWPYFLLLSKFDLRRFCTTLIKNQFSSKRGFCCVLGTFVIKRILLWHEFCKQTIWKHILFGLWS